MKTRFPSLSDLPGVAPVREVSRRLLLASACVLPVVPALIVAEVLADGGLIATQPSEAERSAALAHSRAVADVYMQELKGALTHAIGTQGVAGAIAVCREQAPAIAARLSAESGARVTRKAERNRNPSAALDDIERTEWPGFAIAPMVSPGKPREKVIAHQKGGEPRLRYLRAIPTAGLCLACHGESLAADVREALNEQYPDDLATGFAEGELRGLFSIDWSLDALRSAMATATQDGAAAAP